MNHQLQHNLYVTSILGGQYLRHPFNNLIVIHINQISKEIYLTRTMSPLINDFIINKHFIPPTHNQTHMANSFTLHLIGHQLCKIHGRILNLYLLFLDITLLQQDGSSNNKYTLLFLLQRPMPRSHKSKILALQYRGNHCQPNPF